MIRKFLYKDEVDRILNSFHLIENLSKYPDRDYAMVLLAYRHGMRCQEVINLKWDQLDFEHGKVYIKRVKNSLSTWQNLGDSEVKALAMLKIFYKRNFGARPYDKEHVFLSARGVKISKRTYQHMIQQIGLRLKFEFPITTHMLRHSCGYELVNTKTPLRVIQDYLGHKNLNHTVLYTKLDPKRFDEVQVNVWKD
jgi:integrase